MKPLINLDELKLEVHGKGAYHQKFGVVSDRIGAKKLGYNLTIVPPGGRACPFHHHYGIEEMFIVLKGTGTLRFGDAEYPLWPRDVIACPAGPAEVAHQIINTSDTELEYLAISTRDSVDVAEFPDSGSVRVIVGKPGATDFRGDFDAAATVDIEEPEGEA
ncbi:MAG: cupin domain-containing protein [Myxococcota bacterium]